MPEIEGLIHISELSDKRVNHPREVVNEGDKLTLRVVKIDIKNRRLGLSLKKVNSAEYLDLDWSTSPTDDDHRSRRSPRPRPSPLTRLTSSTIPWMPSDTTNVTDDASETTNVTDDTTEEA